MYSNFELEIAVTEQKCISIRDSCGFGLRFELMTPGLPRTSQIATRSLTDREYKRKTYFTESDY